MWKKKGITLLSIAPHNAHRTQPLVVSLYGLLTKHFGEKSHAFMKQVDKLSSEPRPRISNDLVQIIAFYLAASFNSALRGISQVECSCIGFRSNVIYHVNPKHFHRYWLSSRAISSITCGWRRRFTCYRAWHERSSWLLSTALAHLPSVLKFKAYCTYPHL